LAPDVLACRSTEVHYTVSTLEFSEACSSLLLKIDLMVISVFLAAVRRKCESQALTILPCSGNDNPRSFKATFEFFFLPNYCPANAIYLADVKYCEPP
jgi:hypothetical protein